MAHPFRTGPVNVVRVAYRPGYLLSFSSFVHAAVLVVSGGSRMPKASRSDGIAALEAVGEGVILWREGEHVPSVP
jgi:hypothetical protein